MTFINNQVLATGPTNGVFLLHGHSTTLTPTWITSDKITPNWIWNINTDSQQPVSSLLDSTFDLEFQTSRFNFSSDDFDGIVKDFRSSLDKSRDTATLSLLAVYLVIFFVSLCGNALVLLVVLRHPGMRTTTNCFLLNLSVADLLVTVMCMPLTVAEMLYKIWLYGEFLCKVSGYMQGVAICASVLTLVTLSVDRFFAIRHPVRYRQAARLLHNKPVLLLIWILALTVMIPVALARRVTITSLTGGHTLAFCHEDWRSLRNRQIFDCVMVASFYVIPDSLVTGLYWCIGCHLLREQSGQTLQRHRGAEGGFGIMRGRRRVARMLIIVAFVFALSWLPYHILNLTVDFIKSTQGGKIVTVLPFALLLGHSHSAQNPLLYFMFHPNMRRAVMASLKCQVLTARELVRFDSMLIRQRRNRSQRRHAIVRRPSSASSVPLRVTASRNGTH